MRKEMIRAMIYGHAVGDALGVPVEFSSREQRKKDPVKEMRGEGTYHMPAGSWSDDTSMTLCLLESLNRLGRLDCDDVMKNFTRWLYEQEFTPTGVVFDVGMTSQMAVRRHVDGIAPLACGGRGERDNGNGSLMRIAPMVIYCEEHGGLTLNEEMAAKIHDVSALTHAHPRSQAACVIFVATALRLLAGEPISLAIEQGVQETHRLYQDKPEYREELLHAYHRLLNLSAFRRLPEEAIKSSGYVVDTLEAVFWCLLHSNSYKECVLRAVNLGEDTDTIAAIAGGLAGIIYGYEAIPSEWVEALKGKEQIETALGN
ncbi:ADP-ribosylglycohydrolase family protein [Mitsuokella sp. WILCCON 0060]|uniref:ADP-ribosylglycohydrolase family protein n=1 Tax=Mitsuokella sp. WILCCON 0060 TaxID=3345341 RepID=UPI003F1C7374